MSTVLLAHPPTRCVFALAAGQVGVRVPSSEPGFFSIAEVQRVSIPYRQVQHRQVLSVLFRPPADAGIEVVIQVATAAASGDGEAAAADTTVSAAAGALVGPLARLNDPLIRECRSGCCQCTAHDVGCFSSAAAFNAHNQPRHNAQV